MHQQGSLEVLRKRIDFSRFEYPNESSPWLRAISGALSADAGTLAVLGSTGLDVRHLSSEMPMPIDPLSLCLAAYVSTLRHKGKKVALALPAGGRHLPLMFAAVGVLADALEGDAPTITRKIVPGGILIVSKDLDLRSRYCDLSIKGISLENAYPGSRLTKDGSVLAITAGQGARAVRGVCFYSPLGRAPSTSLRPNLAILDLRYSLLHSRFEELVNWACNLDRHTSVIALYSIGDSDAPPLLTRSGFENLPIDHQGIAEAVEFQRISPSGSHALDTCISHAPIYLSREHEIICVTGREHEEVFTNIAQMLDAQAKQQGLGIRRARWLYSTLSRLPVPPGHYDISAGRLGRYTLRRLIEHLTNRPDPGMGLALQSLKMQFETLLSHLLVSNPRSERLKELLPLFVDEFGKILILVRDKVSKEAIKNWLREEAFMDSAAIEAVEVLSCTDFYPMALKKYPVVIINGAMPGRYGWINGSALGGAVKYLSYSSEIRSIEKQLQNIFSEERIIENSRSRSNYLLGSGGLKVGNDWKLKRLISPLILKRPVISKTGKTTTSQKVQTQDLKDLSRALESAKLIADKAKQLAEAKNKLEDQAWKDDGADESQITDLDDFLNTTPSEGDPMCFRLSVISQKHGARAIWLAQGELVECIKENRSSEIVECAPEELQLGDKLVLIEESARGSLFERVVELAQSQPELQYIAAYRRQWVEAMKTLAIKYECSFRGYSRLHRDLQANGSSILTTISVRNWILGYVMGPTDVSSIRAVGVLSGRKPIVDDVHGFDKAFKTIRKIHQALGRKLTQTITQTSRLLADEDSESNQRESLWLPVNDILDTVDLAEICEIGTSPALFPAQAVGKLIPNTEIIL